MSNESIPAPAADEQQSTGPASERRDDRSFPRNSFRGRAQAIVFPARPEAEPVECEVMTTDISRGGLSLLYRKQLIPGQQILLVLSETTQLVQVRWCCRAWAGLYAAGCEFIGMPSEGPISVAARAIVTTQQE